MSGAPLQIVVMNFLLRLSPDFGWKRCSSLTHSPTLIRRMGKGTHEYVTTRECKTVFRNDQETFVELSGKNSSDSIGPHRLTIC